MSIPRLANTITVLSVILLPLLLKAEEAYEIKRLSDTLAHEAKVRSLTFSPDGRLLVSASDDGTARIWQIDDGKLKSASDLLPGRSCVAFSPDGKTLFLGQGGGIQKVNIYDVATQRVVRTLEAGHYVLSVSVSRDGVQLATAAHNDEFVKTWTVGTGKQLKALRAPTMPGKHAERSTNRPMGFAAYSPDGRYLAGCVAPSFHCAVPTIWDAKTFEVRSRFIAHDNRCYAIQFSPDSKLLAIGTQDGSVKLWNVDRAVDAWAKKTDEDAPLRVLMPQILTTDQLGGIRGLSFSPNGRLLASVSWKYRTDDGQITVWDLAKGERPVIQLETLGVQAVAFSPNGKSLVTGMHDGSIHVWAVRSVGQR
jgi:WD40 repeat protein